MSNIEGSAIAFPFSINQSGSIAYIQDNDSQIWEDRVKYVVFTYLSERVMRPDFGSRIQELSFENISLTQKLSTEYVLDAFTKWLPKLILNDVKVTADPVNGGINVEIDYTLPSGESQQYVTTVATYNQYGELTQGG
jgi:phage baseplate assembly protein W